MTADHPGKHWFFWSDSEKDNLLSHPGETAAPRFLLDGILMGPLRSLGNQVPDTVAPNVVTMAGLVCLMHGSYLSDKYSSSYPLFTTVICALLSIGYYIMDAIDGIHAARIRNTTNIGSLIVTCVNCVAPILLTLMLCRGVLGIKDNLCIWYCVQGAQLFFLFVHVCESYGSTRSFVRIFIPGPAALVPLFPVLCAIRGLLEVDEVLNQTWWKWVRFVEHFTGTEEVAPLDSWRAGFQTFYVMCLVAVFFACLRSHRDTPSYVSQTQTRLIICLAYRMVPGIIYKMGSISGEDELTLPAVIVDGLFLSVLTSDVVVSKMAKRALHPWIIIFCMISVMDPFVETLLCAAYFFSIFYDLSVHSQIPLFTVQRNVYVDGVYDLCHVGHMKMFEASAKFGNALFVGVVNDDDATPYKRKPVMTHEERCTEVQACRYVTKVIPNAPCNGLSKEFIETNNIHLVVCGEEYYNNPNDIYYCVPKQMGILKAAPRTGGMSTSDLIDRIQKCDAADMVPKVCF